MAAAFFCGIFQRPTRLADDSKSRASFGGDFAEMGRSMLRPYFAGLYQALNGPYQNKRNVNYVPYGG